MGLLEKDKRKFTVIIGSKKCGVCCGTGPSLAAKKVNGKSGAFYLKETTKGSKKKLYGPYSSKKKVVQKGGTLRMELCEILINFFLRCPAYIDNKLDDSYKSIETAFRLLGIIFDSQRYIKLKNLIFLRNNYDIGIPFCELLCSESQEISEDQLDNEVKFIINSRDIIGMSSLNIEQWSNFILHFKRQLKNMEIRNQICLDIIDALNNCESSHVSSISVLLPKLYTRLMIPNNSNSCKILKGILKLRNDYKSKSGQSLDLLDVLFNIGENLFFDTFFINTNWKIINLLLKKSLNEKEITDMWHKIIKTIRKRIDKLVKEQEEHINAREQQSKNMIERMQQSLQRAKAKEEKNQAIINKMKKELEEAKELFPQNSLEQLNNKNGSSELPPSFLLSSQRNGKKPTIPSYLLMSTIPKGGPAKESAVNSNNERIAELMRIIKEQHNQNGGPANSNNEEIEALRRAILEQQNPNGTSANQTKHFSNNPNESFKSPLLGITHRGRRNLQPKQKLHNLNNSGLTRSENREQSFKSPLLGITHRGQRNLQPKQKLHNLNNSGLARSENREQSFKSPLLGITHRGRRNQPLHNNQQNQPSPQPPTISNLEARLEALKNNK
jgi:hypothetical protein